MARRIGLCVIVVATRDDAGVLIVTVVPITHSPPRAADEAIKIPEAVKRRLGLDEERSWVVTAEGNQFAWPGPDLRPITRGSVCYDRGVIPPALFRRIRDQIVVRGFRSISREG